MTIFWGTPCVCIVVPSAPRALRVISATDTSLYVTWRSPEPTNGVIQNYRVIYWRTDYHAGSVNRSLRATASAYNITALSPATRYSVQVSSFLAVFLSSSNTVQGGSKK